ncbi:baseplate assembly protein [Thermodesulfovibrio yellowstonii]|uniref:baseplate assembly protein n=1 Tax=Thermodesulfovibrio yellowstonii TaxID=28262 RepID=UPI0024B33659|nr:baseplate J/gp47 family protein [Thermodesulfovibrio yellowstonii]MDI6865771.1 baseplate J/gp47 family protein [Thermodesulfovibrio yellowstonii]
MAIKFIETDPTIYERQLIEVYERLTGRSLNPADPERLIINLIAYAITVCAINIDETGRLNLLATSRGEYLDRLGELVGCSRLPAQRAKTVLRFSLSSPLNFDVIVPQGTRAGASPEKYFSTVKEVKIPAGSLYVDVDGEYFEAGSSGNGFAVGQINKLIDVVPYVASVTNITMSMHGVDTESDDRYRMRIRESLEKFSNAGSREAYRYHVMTAHQEIEDVAVWSPAPGVVKVTFIMRGGALPDDSIINAVSDLLNGEKIRPLTDVVYVVAPEVVSYSINLIYYIEKGQEGLQSIIDKEIGLKAQEFALWSCSKLGRDVLPEKLTEMVMSVKGVHSIEISSPQKIALSVNQIGQCQSITITYGGTKE